MVYRSSHFDTETATRREKKKQFNDVRELGDWRHCKSTLVNSLDEIQMKSTISNKTIPKINLYVRFNIVPSIFSRRLYAPHFSYSIDDSPSVV